MMLLGLLLLAASVGAAVSIAVSNTDSASFDVFGQTVTGLSPGGVMLLGIGLGVAGLIGLLMISAGMRHSRRRRQQTKQVVQESRSRVDELEEENVRLREAVKTREFVATTAAPRAEQSSDDRSDAYDRSAGHDDPGDTAQDRMTEAERHDAVSNVPDSADTRANDKPGGVYPHDAAYATAPVDTPAFDDTARNHGNRVFGRRKA